LAQLREELDRSGTDWRPALAFLAVPSPREPAAAFLGVILMSTKTTAVITLVLACVVGVTMVELIGLRPRDGQGSVPVSLSRGNTGVPMIGGYSPSDLEQPDLARAVVHDQPAVKSSETGPAIPEAQRDPWLVTSFEEQYAGLSVDELREARTQCATALNRAVLTAAAPLFDMGMGVEIEEEVSVALEDTTVLSAMRVTVEGKLLKAILEPYAYPEIYRMKDEAVWVNRRFMKLRGDQFRDSQRELKEEDG